MTATYALDRLPAVGLLLIKGPKPDRELLGKAADAGLFWDAGHRALVARETTATQRAAAAILRELSKTSAEPAKQQPTPTARPKAQSAPAPKGTADGGVRRLPVSSIRTDERRFQNRDAAFSEASVERIVRAFDARKLDPIVVWKDSAGRVYVISGHSRLEAHRRLKLPTIPVRFFDGTEAEAIAFARVESNRGATAESLTEDLKAYRLQRDGDTSLGIRPLTKAQLREQWGADAPKLEAYSYLSPRGKFMRNLALSKNQREQFPFLEQAAQWVGELRKGYPQLTAVHEDEMFDFLQQNRRGVGLSKDEFFARVTKKVAAFTFDPSRALGLNVATTEEEARADTGPAERRRQQVLREITEISERLRAARTQAEKAELRVELEQLQAEQKRLERDIATVLRTQTGLFGARRKKRRTR